MRTKFYLISGQKTCLHVHNVFPYLLIKPFRASEGADLDKFMYDLSNEIDKMLNIALCIKDPSFAQHVYKIEPVFKK